MRLPVLLCCRGWGWGCAVLTRCVCLGVYSCHRYVLRYSLCSWNIKYFQILNIKYYHWLEKWFFYHVTKTNSWKIGEKFCFPLIMFWSCCPLQHQVDGHHVKKKKRTMEVKRLYQWFHHNISYYFTNSEELEVKRYLNLASCICLLTKMKQHIIQKFF